MISHCRIYDQIEKLSQVFQHLQWEFYQTPSQAHKVKHCHNCPFGPQTILGSCSSVCQSEMLHQLPQNQAPSSSSLAPSSTPQNDKQQEQPHKAKPHHPPTITCDHEAARTTPQSKVPLSNNQTRTTPQSPIILQ